MQRIHLAILATLLANAQLAVVSAQSKKNDQVLETVESVDVFDDTRAIVDMAVPYGSRASLTYEQPTKTAKGNKSKKTKTVTILVRGTTRHRHVRLPELPHGAETKVTVHVWWQPTDVTCEAERTKACKAVYVMNGERHFVHFGRLEFESKSKAAESRQSKSNGGLESQGRRFIEYFWIGS